MCKKLRKCLVVLENFSSTEATDMSGRFQTVVLIPVTAMVSHKVFPADSASVEIKSFITRNCRVKLCRLPQSVGVPSLSDCQVVLEKLAPGRAICVVNTSPFHVAESCEENTCSATDDDSRADECF